MKNDTEQKWDRNRLGIFEKLSLLIFFVVMCNADFSNSRMIWWGTFGFVIVVFILYAYENDFTIKKNNIKYIAWNVLFISFSVLSSLWAVDSSCSFEITKKMLIRSMVLWFVSIVCNEKTDFLDILKLFIIASVINSLYILLAVDLTTLGNVRIGAGSLGEEWNANGIGMTMAFSAFMAYFLFKNQKNKKEKLLYLMVTIFFGIIVLFTGSKKALFIFIFAPLLFYYVTSENKIRTTILILLGGICLLYLIMNVSSLYNVIGKRIKKFLFYFTKKGKPDSSTLSRMKMIKYGFLCFKRKPILGYGINNYIPLFGRLTGWYTYSHNNYIELLVGIGIVGTAIYYFSYIYILKKTLGKKDLFSVFACVSIITILIVEIGLVSYITFYIQLLICLGFSVSSINEQKGMTN